MSGIRTWRNWGGAAPGVPSLLTAARTACPRATNSRQRTAPTKPDAPVTRMRMIRSREDAAFLFSVRRGILASLYLRAIWATTIRALSERKGGASGRLLIPGSSLGRIRQPPLADVAAAPAEAIPAPCFRAQHAAGHGIAAARP